MVANREAMFVDVPKISWNASGVTAANTAKDGTGTVITCFTADPAGDGAFIDRLRIKPMGTNIQTVLRVWINNGADNNVASNNTLWDDLLVPAFTNTETSSSPTIEVPMGFILPPGYKINVTLGTAIAAGLDVTTIAGEY